MPVEAMMKHLAGPIWFAHPKRFLKPGFYYVAEGNKRVLPLPAPPRKMHLETFAEVNVVFAEGQPEYEPLPAHRFNDPLQGRIVCCWKLNFIERIKILFTGRIWHQILTFDSPLQPQLLSVEKPEMKREHHVTPDKPWPRK